MASETEKEELENSGFYAGSHELERVLAQTELPAMPNGHLLFIVVGGGEASSHY